MWYLKFKLHHKDCLYTPKTKQFNVRDFMYPIGIFVKNNIHFLSAIHILEGKESNKEKYFNYLKRSKDVIKTEISENLIFTLAKEKHFPKEYKLVYNPSLFFPTPMINNDDGFEYWEIASWDREPLQDIIKEIERSDIFTYFEVLKFVEKKLDDVYLMRLLPKLSPKQREVIELAVKEGYYTFPKKTNLEKLANVMKVSKSAVHEFLAKAEEKLMPFLIRK